MRHGRLLLGSGGNLLVLIDDHAHCAKNILQRLLHFRRLADSIVSHFMAAAHGLHRGRHTALQLRNHLLNFFGRLLSTFGQSAHLISYHGKAAPLLAGPRGLNRGVECQQVGLLSNALDHFQYPADGSTVSRQLIDHCH